MNDLKRDNVTNFNGLRLVVNPDTYEFYLFAEADKPGILYGELPKNTTQIKYHVKRGSKTDGIITTVIEIVNMPFELTYFAPKPQKLLNDHTPSNQKEVTVKELPKFAYLDPERYESGEERQPPKHLNSKKKKQWQRELTTYLQHKKLQEEVKAAEPVKPIEETKAEETVKEAPSKTEEPKLPTELPPVVENALSGSKPKDVIHGQGNKECVLEEYKDGFVIAHIDVAKSMIVVLGTPNYPDTGFQRFLVFPTEKQANFCYKRLQESDFYRKQIIDGIRTFTVMPATSVPGDKFNVPALAIHDVFKYLNSRLMKIVKKG